MEKTEDKMVRKRRYLTPEAKYQIFVEATMAKAICFLPSPCQASGSAGADLFGSPLQSQFLLRMSAIL